MKQYLAVYKRYRTPVLAVLATLMLVGSAVWSFDIPWQVIAEYFVICMLGVAVIAVAAGVLVAIIKALR